MGQLTVCMIGIVSFLERGDQVTQEKELETKYDKEAIMVKMEGSNKIGYVVNSPHTALGDS
jgi:hypothetical protein